MNLRPMRSEGYIYFIKSHNVEDNIIVKVGKTAKERKQSGDKRKLYKYEVLIDRLKGIQTGNPYRLRMVKALNIFTNVNRAEKIAHKFLDDRTFKMNGEWYAIKKKEFEDICVAVKDEIDNKVGGNSQFVDDIYAKIKESERKSRIEFSKNKAYQRMLEEKNKRYWDSYNGPLIYHT